VNTGDVGKESHTIVINKIYFYVKVIEGQMSVSLGRVCVKRTVKNRKEKCGYTSSG